MLLILISANAQTLRGDVNGDGKVDASDVSDLVTIILNAGLTEDDIYKNTTPQPSAGLTTTLPPSTSRASSRPCIKNCTTSASRRAFTAIWHSAPSPPLPMRGFRLAWLTSASSGKARASNFCTTPTTPKAGTTAMPSTLTMPARLRLRHSTASRRSNSTDSTPHLSSCGQATQQSSPTICPS